MADTPNNEHEARTEARMRSRREILTKGAKLAFIAPVVLAVAPTNIVAAGSKPSKPKSADNQNQHTGTDDDDTGTTDTDTNTDTDTDTDTDTNTDTDTADDTDTDTDTDTGDEDTGTADHDKLRAVLVPVTGSNASGSIKLTFNPEEGQICYKLKFSGFDTNVTSAHIHYAATGSVAVNLQVAGGADSPVKQCVPAAPTLSAAQALIEQILANPQNFYVNVHTQEHPGGEIQGTLG